MSIQYDQRTVPIAQNADTVVLAPNAKRRRLIVSAFGGIAYVKFDRAVTATGDGLPIALNSIQQFTADMFGDALTGELHAWTASSPVSLNVMEFFDS